MHTGQVVTYTAADGAADDAVVLSVGVAGPSGAKTLDVLVRESRVGGVPHADDAAPGAAHWTLRSAPAPDVSRAVIDQQIVPALEEAAADMAAAPVAPAPAPAAAPAAPAPWDDEHDEHDEHSA